MGDSLQQSAEAETAKKKRGSALADPQNDDDDDSDDDDDFEEQLRGSLQEALGAVMETHPTDFQQCLPECIQHLTQWVQTKRHRPLAMFLASDLVKYLREASQPTWPVFMPAVFQGLKDKDVEARISASYLINVAAQLPDFAEAAPDAFRQLAQLVSASGSKKRKDREKIASDNAVAALLVLARYQEAHCPPDIGIGNCWGLVVNKLPLKEDGAEAKMVHEAIVDMVIQENVRLIGPAGENLGKVLSCLAEVYRDEDLSNKTVDEKIHRVFQALPQGKLIELSSCLSEKQQKRVEKMRANA